MRGAFFIVVLSLAGCQCVQVPDLRYACTKTSDCAGDEQCAADGFCARADAGPSGGGGGATGGGTAVGGGGGTTGGGGGPTGGGGGGTGGGGVPGPETDCGNGLDDDLDGFIDCLDLDCEARRCRAAVSTCDAEEVCTTGGQCPPDVARTAGSSCDDGTPCTDQDACLPDAGCAGRPGERLLRCTQPGIIEILTRQACPPAGALCGQQLPAESLLAREIPDAAVLSLGIASPPAPDGGCVDPNSTGGAMIIADVCGDWTLYSGAVPAGLCATNVASLKVSATPFDGGVAVYQYRYITAPKHTWTLSRSPQPGQFPDPSDPVFYACPP